MGARNKNMPTNNSLNGIFNLLTPLQQNTTVPELNFMPIYQLLLSNHLLILPQ